MDVSVYNTTGSKTDTYTLPSTVFEVPWNADLVHQVVTTLQANRRAGIAHTKDRSEVRGGGRKPWRQKGTGRARHGSRRSPLWTGGGVTHGPRNEKAYTKKVNRKMRLRALGAVLTKKVADGEVLFVDDLPVADGKTKEAVTTLTTLATIENFACLGWNRGANRARIVYADVTDEHIRAFRNIPGVDVTRAAELSVLDVLSAKRLVFVGKEALETLEDRWQRARTRKVKEVATQ